MSLLSKLRPARPVPDALATLADLQRKQATASDDLAVATAALNEALLDSADGKTSSDHTAKAYRKHRDASEAYDLATRALAAAGARLEDAEANAANAVENEVWERIQTLADERVSVAEQITSAIGYVAKGFRRFEEINAKLAELAHTTEGRQRLDRDDAMLSAESLRVLCVREMQRLNVNLFAVAPPFEERQPLATDYKNIAASVRGAWRQRFFA